MQTSFDPLPETQYPVVQDVEPAFARATLNGWFERQDVSPLLAAFLLFLLTFLIFQGSAALIAIGIVAARGGVTDAETLLEALEGATDALLTGNTIGQIIGMAIPVLLWTRLHTRDVGPYLRSKAPDPALVVLAVVGLVALLPIVQWLGTINESLPLPEWIEEIESSQMELIEKVLSGETGLALNIVALAVTPAICEEVLFRGYLLRQVERSFGSFWAIVTTGLLFGLYHFRLSQAIPLAVLGLYLGYITWKTGTVWVAVLIHFVNNGFALLANSFVASNPEMGVESIDAIRIPPLLVIAAVLVFSVSVALLQGRVKAIRRHSGHARRGGAEL